MNSAKTHFLENAKAATSALWKENTTVMLIYNCLVIWSGVRTSLLVFEDQAERIMT